MKIKAVDIFICTPTLPKVEKVAGWECTDIFNRGTRVGPNGHLTCNLTDVFQCRFSHGSNVDADSSEIIELLTSLHERKLRWSDVHVIWAENS